MQHNFSPAPKSIVSISQLKASSGIIACLNLMVPISFIVSKCEIQIGRSSSGMASSQSNRRTTNSCKSSFIVAVIGVILPVGSQISATFDTQCLLVITSGITFIFDIFLSTNLLSKIQFAYI